MAFDVLIRGGTVFDGTGAPGRLGDVAIRNERIAAIGLPGEFDGAVTATSLDATGRFVTPGFIDIHTHSDRSILINPRMESKLRQGVTTEVGGNCGSSPAPSLRVGEPVDGDESGVPATWRSMAEYLETIERAGIAGNYATWTGHGTLRASAVGYTMRPPAPEELAMMQRLLRESLEAGAFGLSTGLIYVPSGFATTDEIVALAEVVREYGGVYATHIRNESVGLQAAIEEAIAVGERAGVPVQVAHHKASGRRSWGLVSRSLERMDRARAAGVDVACDQYPYVASSTGLAAVLPQWAQEGGRRELAARLGDAAVRARLRSEMLAERPEWGRMDEESGWQTVMIASCRGDRSLEGHRLRELALERGQDPFDLCFDLLASENGAITCIYFSMCEPDVETVMRWPQTMIGSDASSVAPYGQLGKGKPHPRAYGTFPRLLGRYVRELGVLRWEEAIHKMTGMPAARLGLADRGTLRAGAAADIVVFDPATVADRATFQKPHQYAIGIEHVFVNGTAVIANAQHTGAMPGRVLRKR